ncbi:MAG: hypothetical protein H6613_18075 [Ignavibacteriales bacterium]|nr:hypothetical protein [Ignavibacteriales bacterium]
MIEFLSILILIISIIYFFVALNKKEISFSEMISIIRDGLKDSSTEKDGNKNIFFRIKTWLIHVTFYLFLFMFLTSFVPTIFSGHLTGLFLILHITAAPLFSISLALLVLFYAYQLKLNENDYSNFEKVINKDSAKNDRSSILSYSKFSFWLLTFISIPLLLSIILSFYPIAGTDWQNLSLIIHRLSALLFSLVVLALIYFYVTFSKL